MIDHANGKRPFLFQHLLQPWKEHHLIWPYGNAQHHMLGVPSKNDIHSGRVLFYSDPEMQCDIFLPLRFVRNPHSLKSLLRRSGNRIDGFSVNTKSSCGIFEAASIH